MQRDLFCSRKEIINRNLTTENTEFTEMNKNFSVNSVFSVVNSSPKLLVQRRDPLCARLKDEFYPLRDFPTKAALRLWFPDSERLAGHWEFPYPATLFFRASLFSRLSEMLLWRQNARRKIAPPPRLCYRNMRVLFRWKRARRNAAFSPMFHEFDKLQLCLFRWKLSQTKV